MYKLLKREILHKNKIFIISLLFLFIFLLLHTNKVYANGYSFVIEDDADLYTSEEEEMLKADYNDIADNQNVYVKTTTDTGDSSTAYYAQQFYNSKFGDTSGTIFLIDMNNRQVYIYSNNATAYLITSKISNVITDNVYRYLTKEKYYEGTNKALYQMYKALHGMSIESPMLKITSILMGILLGFILTFYGVLFSSIQKKKDSTDDRNSLMKHEFNCSNLTKTFIRTYTESSSSSSSGGGSSSGGSSSGGGHSF